jgi:tripartite-type tricarboxylate transporter receptor subunit TctC
MRSPVVVAALAAAVFAPAAAAQQYPAKVIRLVTGSQAAGGTDVTARAIQARLIPAIGQQIVVDNRPGLAGMVANEYTAKQPADGYTLLIQPGSFVTVSTQLNANPPWDPLKHLAPVIQVSNYDFVLVAHPSVPAKNVKELVAVARAKPRGISFASTGVGSNFHLAGELLKITGKVDMLHVAYRGSAQAVVDLVAGRVDTMFVHVPTVKGYIDSGRLKPLATTGAARNPLLPSVPTIAESGMKTYEIAGIEGIFAPAGTPRAVIAKLNATIASMMTTPEMKQEWTARAIEFAANTPEQFGATIKHEFEKTAALIKAADIKPER